MRRCLRVVLGGCVLVVLASDARADSITLNIPTNNIFVGWTPIGEYFTGFTLVIPSNLSDLDGATLQLSRHSIVGSGTGVSVFPSLPVPPSSLTFDYQLFGTTSAIANGPTLTRPTESGIYSDVTSLRNSGTIDWAEIPFNAAGIAALLAARGGTFSFFGDLVIPDFGAGYTLDEYFMFDGAYLGGAPIARLQLQPVPEPMTLILLGSGMAAAMIRRRRPGATR